MCNGDDKRLEAGFQPEVVIKEVSALKPGTR
jgi:hypothetical protein